jgi:hypothetical protein
LIIAGEHERTAVEGTGMHQQGLGSIYVTEYLKILERARAAMDRFPLVEMSPEEKKAVVLSYVELVDRFQQQLKEAGVTRLLDLYDEAREIAGSVDQETERD